jgi:hypothetical protein
MAANPGQLMNPDQFDIYLSGERHTVCRANQKIDAKGMN